MQEPLPAELRAVYTGHEILDAPEGLGAHLHLIWMGLASPPKGLDYHRFCGSVGNLARREYGIPIFPQKLLEAEFVRVQGNLHEQNFVGKRWI